MKRIKKDISPEVRLKIIFKNYRHMTPSIKRELEDLGFIVEKGRKHIIIRKNQLCFSCPSTPSDYRSGLNFANILKKSL